MKKLEGVNLPVILPSLVQKKMPTLTESGDLTYDRLAPAGHGFVGFTEIMRSVETDSNEIICIGNGEDLNSTPDLKVLSHIIRNNIPVTMITTTKTKADLKGGQLALKREDGKDVLTIIEKAQAEESGQLEYFENLGLREGDLQGLFNTNMAIINSKALRKSFQNLGVSKNDFIEGISPDVIKNKKEENGRFFTQLEAALGSVLLNMNQFFVKSMGKQVLHICNVSEENRYKFFLPIKSRADYNSYLEDYVVDEKTYTLVPRR